MEKKFTCIRCPQGCEITTSIDGYGAVTSITGNSCKLGVEYVKSELTDPRRTLTTTVRVEGGTHPLCPVWTESPVPKDKVMEIAVELRKVVLKAPVKSGQVVIQNVAETHVDVVASKIIQKSYLKPN